MIGETFRLLRVFNDYTMNEMSQKIGLSQSYISELESGKKQPSLEVVEKYAEAFEMKPSTLLLFSESLEIEQVSHQDQKQRVARAGMRLLKILEKLEKLDEE